jgi:hypothetical protein
MDIYFKISTPKSEIACYGNHPLRPIKQALYSSRQRNARNAEALSKIWMDHHQKFATLAEAETYASNFQIYKIFKVELIQSFPEIIEN